MEAKCPEMWCSLLTHPTPSCLRMANRRSTNPTRIAGKHSIFIDAKLDLYIRITCFSEGDSYCQPLLDLTGEDHTVQAVI